VWLTARLIDRTGAQAGPSDPAHPYGRDAANEMKCYAGDATDVLLQAIKSNLWKIKQPLTCFIIELVYWAHTTPHNTTQPKRPRLRQVRRLVPGRKEL